MAIDYKRQGFVESAWHRNGVILVKKKANERPKAIRCKEDLQALNPAISAIFTSDDEDLDPPLESDASTSSVGSKRRRGEHKLGRSPSITSFFIPEAQISSTTTSSVHGCLLETISFNVHQNQDNFHSLANRKFPQILFWNVQGYNNLCENIGYFENYDIICCSETWHLNEIKKSPSKSFDLAASSLAIKEKSRGRGSGGLLIFVKCDMFKVLVVKSCHWWLILELKRKSINDLIWCNNANMDDIYDLKILNNISMSDHFPVLLQLNFNYQQSTCNFSDSIANKVDVFRWDSNKSVLYKEFMMYSDKVSILSKSSDILYENFLNTLTYAATCLGLKYEKIVYNKPNYSFNKPWYDLELKASKKLVKQQLSVCRRSGFLDLDYKRN
uniref:Endonuclease/exonuclease/phosphatase domain-containing protein n=1 Tax=Rhodnius prolixus TaxID=13249 RepID=T1I3T0_RHOPR